MTEEFSPEERAALAPYVTNLDGPVFALTNLPEVVKGALFARYSRSPKSLRRLLLDEFMGTASLWNPVGAVFDTTRADQLYERVFLEYGDDSVAQLGGVHLACEGASNILTKVLEWGRLMAYLEQSTRYVPYDDQPGGHYRYHTPAELEGPSRQSYIETLDATFDRYRHWLPRLCEYFAERFPRGNDSEQTHRIAIRAKALDVLRGFLPAATTSNVGIFATGQAYEQLLLRMRAHPLAEVRLYADLMLTELRKIIPGFVRRVDMPDRGGAWSTYLIETRGEMKDLARRLLGDRAPQPQREVSLVDFDPDGELKIVASALYSASNLPDEQLVRLVRDMPAAQREAILRTYVGNRENRRHKPGRAFERTSYRFDILTDYGAFRDLQRHRMLSLEWQRLTPEHGFITPSEIDEVGAGSDWRAVMDSTAKLYNRIVGQGLLEAASYVVPMAYRVRFYMEMNAREAMHVIELRTAPQGHPSYRRVCQEMHRLIADEAGHRGLAAAMQFVNRSTVEMARLDSERALERRVQGRPHGSVLYPPEFVANLPRSGSWDNRPLLQLLVGVHRDPSAEIERIERWFHELHGAEDRKKGLAQNLRSKERRAFWAALFELLTSRIFMGQGWSVTYEKELQGLTPDFYVEARDPVRSHFVADVITAFQSPEEEIQERDLYIVADALNQIEHRLSIFIENASLPARTASLKPLVAHVRSWLDDCSMEKEASLHLNPPDWPFDVTVSTCVPPRDRQEPIVTGIVGIPSRLEADERIRRAVAAKAERYARLKTDGVPLVLFVWEGDWIMVTDHSLEAALFGRESLVLKRRRGVVESTWVRTPEGVFGFSHGGSGEPRNTLISAVAYCSRIWHQGRVYAEIKMYHHPFAIHRLPWQLFDNLPQCVPVDMTSESVTLRWMNFRWGRGQDTLGVLLQ